MFPFQFSFLHVKFNYILNFAFINPFLVTLSLIFKRGFNDKFSEEREFEMSIFFSPFLEILGKNKKGCMTAATSLDLSLGKDQNDVTDLDLLRLLDLNFPLIYG